MIKKNIYTNGTLFCIVLVEWDYVEISEVCKSCISGKLNFDNWDRDGIVLETLKNKVNAVPLRFSYFNTFFPLPGKQNITKKHDMELKPHNKTNIYGVTEGLRSYLEIILEIIMQATLHGKSIGTSGLAPTRTIILKP